MGYLKKDPRTKPGLDGWLGMQHPINLKKLDKMGKDGILRMCVSEDEFITIL